MVTSRQIKEKFRDYRRSFKHSWLLFKESRIGLLGLGIMLVFIVIALVSPFLGLRHPTQWWAPDEDILDIDAFFGEDGIRTNGPFTQGLAYRMQPAAGTASSCDRIYAAGGSEGSVLSPYGLYAFDQLEGGRAWDNNPFPTNSFITTKVILNNFGSDVNPASADLRIFFGCEDGRIYVLKDEFGTPASQLYPSGRNRWSYQLDGSVSSSLAYYDLRDNQFNALDRFFAATDDGYLYAFQGPIDPSNTSHNPTLMWSLNVSTCGLTAPTVSSDGQYVFVGSRDGVLHGFVAATGFPIPEWLGLDYTVSNEYWSTSPVAIGTPCVVYAASDDGMLHSIWGGNGSARPGWEDGYEITAIWGGEPDRGNLTDIGFTPDGSTVLIGSDTGYFYAIDTHNVSVSMYFDTGVGMGQTECIVTPYYDWRFSKYLFVTANNLNGTAADPSDDFTILYCLASTGNDTVIWRKTIPGVVKQHPISFINNEAGHISKADVLLATVYYESDGTVTAGRMYSFNAAGFVKTPLPPSWATDDKPSSGNSYLLGTDAQGHDILSQTLLGSRVALLVGFLSAGFSIGIGLIIGLVSGYYGGAIDAVLMRFTDVILVLPALPLLITFAAIMSPSIWNIIIIISIIGWGGVARVIRAEVLSLKERPFIDSARVTGASKSRIMFKHIAPNVIPLALLYMTFAVSGAILFEAALSFIGLGDPNTMTWGMMLNYVQHSNALNNWWWLLPPGLCITLVCMAFFLLGRAFDEIVNPRLRRRR
jgi:peptide/nickel transport system permease protein